MFSSRKARAIATTIACGVAVAAGSIAVSYGSGGGTSSSNSVAGRAGGPPGGVEGRPQGGFDTGLTAAASYLGLTTSELQARLQNGKTLAQIAASTSGKSKAGLIVAIVAAERANAPDTQSTASITQRVTAMVSGVRPTGAPPHGAPGGTA